MKNLPLATKMAFIFLLIILLISSSLTFINWKVDEVNDDATRVQDVHIPTSLAVHKLSAGINSSLASLRGWVITGSDEFKSQRKDVWLNEIDQSINQLERLSLTWNDDKNLARLDEIKGELKYFREYQQDVENISNTDNNVPALKLFVEQAEPQIKIIINAITSMIDEEATLESSSQRKSLLTVMANFRASTALLESNMRFFLLTSEQQYLNQYDIQKEKNADAFFQLKEQKNSLKRSQLRNYESIAEANRTLADLPKKIFDIHRSQQSNMADYLLTHKAIPVSKKIINALDDMVRDRENVLVSEFLDHGEKIQQLKQVTMLILISSVIFITLFTFFLIRLVADPIKRAVSVADSIGEGNYDIDVQLSGSSEMSSLGSSLAKMKEQISKRTSILEQQNWIRTETSKLMELAQGGNDLGKVTNNVITYMSELVNAGHGVFYLKQQSVEQTGEELAEELCLVASYAFKERKNIAGRVAMGEGLVGQCAKERKTILLTQVPDDYIKISSALGEKEPLTILVQPVLFEDELLGVIELASFREFSDDYQEVMLQTATNLGVVINKILTSQKTEELLIESQAQAEELQTQQEELRVANNSLEEQTNRLKESEQNLQQQSEELRVANEELEEKQELQQKQNQELELAKHEVDKKAADLAKASKYKSEFLANMSHELRTPLNSLLILSKNLAKNKQGNLTDDQVEDASVIYEGGNSLLTLINDIMDLSKVEAGMLQVNKEHITVDSITTNIERLFSGLATEKNLNFIIERQQDLPTTLTTDGLRLEQIIKNFLSNAFKFTDTGSVTLKIHTPQDHSEIRNPNLAAQELIAISVIDTGIGVPKEKQQLIFEAFQQEDGSTTRKYGGTGLGLTISRELASLLGGEITLTSEPGQGCNVTLYLPLSAENLMTTAKPVAKQPLAPERKTVLNDSAAKTSKTADIPSESQIESTVVHENFINDDRRSIHQGDPCVLIIEDDKNFAKILRDIAHEDNYKCLVTDKGREGIYLAKEFKPHGILLDMGLPDIDGIHVLEQLKFNLITRHIPVHVISGNSRKQQSLEHGAYNFIEKPAQTGDIKSALAQFTDNNETRNKRILVVEDDKNTQHAIERLLDVPDIELIFVASGDEVLEQLNQLNFDCIVLDLGLPDISGMEVLDKINQLAKDKPPVIVYTGQEISDEDQMILGKYADDIIIKGVESPERLLDDVTLFLHSVGKNLPSEQQQTIQMLHNEDEVLKGRRILLVDDDMRNVFAMSRQLTDAGLDIVMAENGQKAIEALDSSDKVFELVLMDIMMPVMDGYEAMRRIRKMPTYKDIPIIALTAKAMTEDRHRCFEAGASEYITKPVDMEKLLSILGVWLYKHKANNG